jgi:hypothetical protein
MSIDMPSIGIIVQTIPRPVISQVVLHIITGIGIMPAIIGIMLAIMFIGVMPGIMPAIIGIMLVIMFIGVMPGIMPGVMPGIMFMGIMPGIMFIGICIAGIIVFFLSRRPASGKSKKVCCAGDQQSPRTGWESISYRPRSQAEGPRGTHFAPNCWTTFRQ